MRKLFITVFASSLIAYGFTGVVQAEPQSSVTRTSANHTKIVIHDNSPQAAKERKEQARRARERLDLKEQRAQS